MKESRRTLTERQEHAKSKGRPAEGPRLSPSFAPSGADEAPTPAGPRLQSSAGGKCRSRRTVRGVARSKRSCESKSRRRPGVAALPLHAPDYDVGIPSCRDVRARRMAASSAPAQAHFYTPALRSRASARRAGGRTDPMTCTTSWIRGARVLLLELRASRVRAWRLSPPAGRIAASDLLKSHAVLLAASGNDAQLRMPILAARAEEMGEPISVR